VSACPACENEGGKRKNQRVTYYTCTDDSCDVWFYGKENTTSENCRKSGRGENQ